MIPSKVAHIVLFATHWTTCTHAIVCDNLGSFNGLYYRHSRLQKISFITRWCDVCGFPVGHEQLPSFRFLLWHIKGDTCRWVHCCRDTSGISLEYVLASLKTSRGVKAVLFDTRPLVLYNKYILTTVHAHHILSFLWIKLFKSSNINEMIMRMKFHEAVTMSIMTKDIRLYVLGLFINYKMISVAGLIQETMIFYPAFVNYLDANGW